MRDVLFVEDMLGLLDLQIKQIAGLRGAVFNLGGGAANSISLREATAAMQEISSRTVPITQTDKARQGDIVLYWTDNRKAAQHLGFKPQTDLRTGFTRIFEWIRQNETELRSRYVQSCSP
jgi:CDP-paratose 2-epimerase